jgi:ubiquinone/menaquinone biosynthesis C-methylase UbiE
MALMELMHNKPFHAKVDQPKRILDIGCGTGTMTVLLAERFPEAEVIGIDISEVPPRSDTPSNVTFIQGNIMDSAIASKDPRFAPGSFDYIFHRLLVFGITDWKAYISKVHDLLAPGGWAEMQDYDIACYSASGECISELWEFYHKFVADGAALGLDMRAGKNLAPRMRAAGYSSVDETFYHATMKRDPAHPEADRLADMNAGNMVQSNKILVEKLSGPRRSKEEVDEMIVGFTEKYWGGAVGDHSKMYVVTGRKEG